ncbi:DNA polymerase I [Marinicauda pacifica]|uniref:DNA polymerase I n=1 Tax=Marinicauda pacifica TaxID=1133559 RepID=A0A4S2HBQ7_9PROT|nr:DNA polymerase I [Marinicauda pacifica]TGY93346.1 DNA polymerase I [Marinicauda pacifica]GGE44943.1 DNA polymerase I [Marinicauda pacifica]
MAVTRALDANSHLYLVDGSAYIFRAYHALPPLTRSDGTPVGAVQGFCNMLWKLLEDLKGEDQPTHMAVIFDHSAKTFRNEIYEHYKAHRPEPPEDLVPQFSLIREATIAFDLPCIEMEGFEADDIMATYARLAVESGARVTLATSDKDMMQLVNGQVTMLDPMKNKRIGPDEVREKFGVGPERVIDVQALAGDSVDNVPGVPGIGIKTAAQLIEEYGDLDGLLSRADEIKQPKRREKLIENAELARISRQLVTLKTDVADVAAMDDFGTADPDPDRLLTFLRSMEFRTLTRRVEEGLGAGPADETGDATAPVDRSAYETVQTLAQLETWIARAREARVVAVDTETDALSATHANLVGISLAVAPGQACYIPLAHEGGDLADGGGRPEQIDFDTALGHLKPLLESPSVLKVGQNFKYDLSVFARYGIAVAPYDDTMLLSYVQESGLHGHGMDELADLLLGHTCITFKEVCGSGKSQKHFGQCDLKSATEYAAEDADITLRLYELLKPSLAQRKLTTVYETLERPMPAVLSRMELAGIRVDVAQLSRLSSDFAQKMAESEEAAHSLAGTRFNLGSPKQIGEILFGQMGLPGGKKTKGGAWSTDASVLDQLAAEGHELPQALLTWRQFAKLKSTYSDALKDAINPHTGRVHTNFSLAATSTGRLSSSEPNLQNIPIRTEEGRKIREAFVAEDGHVLVAADYSQIELRLLAHIAGIDALKEAFKAGHDIHAMTASEMFGVPMDEMDPVTRRKAKAINFGIIYGISAFGLSANLGIGRDEAKAYIDAYFEKFPGIRAYMDEMKAAVKATGHVETLFGRRIHLPGIKDKNPSVRQFAERQAINAPIQGAAADIIRRAMIVMESRLQEAGLKARMLLQVHDELVFECAEDEADRLIVLAQTVMSEAALPAVQLSVPLDVEAKAAKTWGQAH